MAVEGQDQNEQKGSAPHAGMPAVAAGVRSRELMAVIGDEDSVTGLLLAGIGQVDDKNNSNYLVVSNKTTVVQIEEAFKNFTEERKDIAILLITQQVSNEIRHLLDAYSQIFPTILEIPSKDTPYDPSKDSVLNRVKRLAGN